MEHSKIEWTDHTFNPWWGCTKVSAGCKNCYAETLDGRFDGGHWGPGSSRKPMSEAYWKKPLQWDKQAAAAGVQAKVFCASMADVFEDKSELDEHRTRLFNIIDSTPNLIWQLLTKRPENIVPFTPVWSKFGWPDNVWVGTSVENQEAANQRIPHLLNVPAKVRFLSCEPLIGPVDISDWLYPKDLVGMEVSDYEGNETSKLLQSIHWVIVGGESGRGARPMHPEWARSLKYQCQAAGVPFFFKQWGEWADGAKGGTDPSNWIMFGNEGSIFQGNDVIKRGVGAVLMSKVGKNASGGLLDGKESREFPL